MTREEAKAYIIRHCNPDYPKGKTEWETAINMAIKALSREPSEDCISRKALLAHFYPWLKVEDYSIGERNMLKALLYEVKVFPPAKPEQRSSSCGQENDLISRQAAIDALVNGALVNYQAAGHNNGLVKAIDVIKGLPSAQPERKKMSNKEWIDFLSVQFTVSRTTAREMLHALMKWKAEDNFKKEFSSKKDGEA